MTATPMQDPLVVWNAMKAAAHSQSAVEIAHVRDMLKAAGLTPQVRVEQVASAQRSAGMDYVQLDRTLYLLLGDADVYSWSDQHFGYFGGGGAGWFVELEQTNISDESCGALEVFGIDTPEPSVPKPAELEPQTVEAALNRLLDRVRDRDGSSGPYDAWLVDDEFLCEPRVGGVCQALSDVDATGKHLMRISSEEFDELTEAFYREHGVWPDS